MSSGAKKEKSFNGTKAKFSPNAAVPEKKTEVKLRRKDSEKVKQPSDSNRKSVLGRFFHNLVDSDDSRKKAAAADAKKKKGRDPTGSDLDLPEHGIVLRKNQTLQRDAQLVPSPRTRAMTLANQQGRDNRNRWSSYDIPACNFSEGALPPTVPETDYSTMGSMGHRSQSEETLNALLSTDPRSMVLSKVKDSFITHADSGRQPDTMRKHAQLLQSIQETNTNRLSRSDKTIDAPAGQSSNGYLLTTEMVIDGQKKDASGITGNNPDQKLNDLQKTSSCDSAAGSRELRLQNSTATSTTDALVLLDEKNKQLDKALADKRRILSQLFGVAEEDLGHLLEKDVDLSADLSVRKMILISLLQSDQLTSVISSLLVPLNSGCTDGAVDKDAAAVAAGETCLQNKASSQSQLLHKVASRLHGHLTLLQQMVDRDVAETDRLRKDLESAQQQIKIRNMPSDDAKLDLPEVSLPSDKVVQQRPDLSISTEAQGGNIESLSNLVDNVSESSSEQNTETTVNVDRNVADNKEKSEEGLPVTEELLNITDNVKDTQPVLDDSDDKTDTELSSDVSENVLPHVDVCIENADGEVHATNEVIVPNDEGTSGQQQESVPSCEIREALLVSSDESMNDVIVPAEVTEDYQTDFQGVNDNVEKLVDETDDSDNPYHSDSNRKFRNLESIPEDDDRQSCSDVEPKVCASENLYQEIVLKCDIEVPVEDDVEATLTADGVTHPDVTFDARSVVEEDTQSNFKEDLQPNSDGVQSAVADDLQSGVGDVRSDVEDVPSSNMQENFPAFVDYTLPDVQDANPSIISNTPLHANDDTPSSATNDAQSDAQKDVQPNTIDDPPLELDEIQTSAADGEDSSQGHVPVITADVNAESGGNLHNSPELQSTVIEEVVPPALDRRENLESQEEERLETETEREYLEVDTGVETNVQPEKNSSTESETDEETDTEVDRSSEPDVPNMLESSLLKSEPMESLHLEAERLPVYSEDISEQIPNGSDIASGDLMEVEEISYSDIIVEEGETADISEPKTVVEGLLHNHVQKEGVKGDDEFSHENAKSEISEAVDELLDLSECDKKTIIGMENGE